MASRFFRYDPDKEQVVEVEHAVSTNIPRYPIYCETLAVHPDQIGEQRDFDRSHGVPTDYRADGTPIMRDKTHYKRYRKLHGFHQKNGYES